MTSYQEFLKYQKVFHEHLRSIGKHEKSKYEILTDILYQQPSFNITPKAEKKSSVDVRVLYKKLVLMHHPDKGGDPEIFIRLQNAYENNDIYTLQSIEKMNNNSKIKINFETETNHSIVDLGDFWKTTDAYKWYHNIDREYIESKYMTNEESIQYMKLQIAIMLTIDDKEKIIKMLHNLIYKWEIVKNILPSANSSTMINAEIMRILQDCLIKT